MGSTAEKRTVLVTAGASGIGRVTAEAFLAAGHRVHVCDVSPEALTNLARENPAIGASRADVSAVADVDALFTEIEARYGRLDVLVNNAGISGPSAPVEEVSPEDWDRTLAVDLSGAFYVTRKAVPLLKRRGGAIVNMSSTAGLFGCPLRSPYVAAKWAIIGLTKTWAMELGPFGVRVNAICPGSVNGPRIEGVIERDAA
ncbi:MAG: SDR family oxidoreductase, partial [Gammaproteobacteria bacterium]